MRLWNTSSLPALRCSPFQNHADAATTDRRALRVRRSRACHPGNTAANATGRVRPAVGIASLRSRRPEERVLRRPCGWQTVGSNTVAARQQPFANRHCAGCLVACRVLSSKEAPDDARVTAAAGLDVASSFNPFGVWPLVFSSGGWSRHATRNQPGSALVREVRPSPAEQHDEAVAEADQKVNVYD